MRVVKEQLTPQGQLIVHLIICLLYWTINAECLLIVGSKRFFEVISRSFLCLWTQICWLEAVYLL